MEVVKSEGEGEGNRTSVLEVVASSYHAKYNKNCRGVDGVYGGICLKNTVYLLTLIHSNKC